ncbi:hypothetical protein ON010_g6143 [Phytophthora cinnamomi]|nr:hypothetical protein ON010_g6143 [Phytophthora cinnamomi]
MLRQCVAVPPVLGEHFDSRKCGLDCGTVGDVVAAVGHAQADRSFGTSVRVLRLKFTFLADADNSLCNPCRYGAAVHFKIYPIIYALAFLVFLDGDFCISNGKWTSSCGSSACVWIKLAGQLNRDRLGFGVVSGGLFLLLAGGFYYLYGFQFLYEAYLYHFTRTDNRHNFSVYFYDLYLRYNTPSGFGVGLLAFLPQLASLVAVSFAYGRDLPFALFGLTMVFVIFNKVCTAQYFLWYTAFLPLIFPLTSLRLKWKGLAMIAAWLGGEEDDEVIRVKTANQRYVFEYDDYWTFLNIYTFILLSKAAGFVVVGMAAAGIWAFPVFHLVAFSATGIVNKEANGDLVSTLRLLSYYSEPLRRQALVTRGKKSAGKAR